MPKAIVVIPARYGSTRFPGKPLAMIAGKPMIQWVYERAAAANEVEQVLVATDDERILTAVQGFGGQAVMTSTAHATGTDRIAEAVAGIEADIVVNMQGDEPLIPSALVDELVRTLTVAGAEMGTVAVPFGLNDPDVQNPNMVKVVVDASGQALYFSRAPIPFCRSGGEPVPALRHWGIYAFRRDFLERFVSWPQSCLEKCEMLEQLRALENGARIMVVQTPVNTVGVDTPEDLRLVEKIILEQTVNSGA